MSFDSWQPLVEEYLAFRRGLGFALETPAWLLRDFARYADRIEHRTPLTREPAVDWALASRSKNPAQAVRRPGVVRHRGRSERGPQVKRPARVARRDRARPPHRPPDRLRTAPVPQRPRHRVTRTTSTMTSSSSHPAPAHGQG